MEHHTLLPPMVSVIGASPGLVVGVVILNLALEQ
jgi:hypothetical protein